MLETIIVITVGLLLFGQSAHLLASLVRLPYVVTLALMAVVAVGVLHFPALSWANTWLSQVPAGSDIMLNVLLPVLLFQGALAIDVRHLVRDGVAVVLLAVFAVLLSVGVIGGVLHLVTGISLVLCMLLGSIVATTDPSAVIAVFRSLGAPPRLTRLVEGESLLNDATAIAVFTALLGASLLDTEVSGFAVSYGLVSGFGLGLIAGLLLGGVLSVLTGLVSGFASMQLTLVLIQPFLVFMGVGLIPGASPVIGVVVAGIVLGTIGRSRFSRENFDFMDKLLAQCSDWATGLIVVLAALAVPRLVETLTWVDVWLVLLTALAAFAARFLVLWALAPILSFLRMMRPIDEPMKVALLWGGLRGAMTLALALAAVESGLSQEASRFILVTATGYALFTLFVQGTSLKLVMRVLKLNVLPEAEQAFRDQALREALVNTRTATLTFARRIGLRDATSEERLVGHDERIDALLDTTAYESLPDMEKLRLGLAAMVAHERSLVLTQKTVSGLPTLVIDKYLYALDRMRDAARSEGRVGYLRAARRPLLPASSLRVLIGLHNWFGISWPLSRHMARRFHHLLVTRILVTQTMWYVRTRLPGVFGDRVAQILAEIMERRLEGVMEQIEAIRLQYPAFAGHMEEAMVARYALKEERKQIDELEEEGMIDAQVARVMRQEGERLARETRAQLRVDIERPRPELLRALPMFEKFSDGQLKRLSRAMRSIYVPAGKVVYRPEDQITHIYFIASGAIEVMRGEEKTRLGAGEVFGQLRILNPKLEPATVKAIAYSHCFRLPVKKFREFLREAPDWKAALEKTGPVKKTDTPS